MELPTRVPCMCTHQIVTRHLRLHLRACALHLHRRPRIHCATSHASHAAVPVHPGAGALSPTRPFIISIGELDISVGELEISVGELEISVGEIESSHQLRKSEIELTLIIDAVAVSGGGPTDARGASVRAASAVVSGGGTADAGGASKAADVSMKSRMKDDTERPSK